jgi:hypothetical protein
MAAECRVKIIGTVTGLGPELEFSDNFTTTTTPTKAAINRQIQASADTDEILNLCGISTIELIIIRCVTNDVNIDTDYVSAFDPDVHIPEGETRIIKPSGVVRIKNDDAAEVSTIDYLIVGSA